MATLFALRALVAQQQPYAEYAYEQNHNKAYKKNRVFLFQIQRLSYQYKVKALSKLIFSISRKLDVRLTAEQVEKPNLCLCCGAGDGN